MSETAEREASRPAAARSAPPAPRGGRGLSLATVCVGMMMTFLNLTATISSLSGIQADLHVSTTTLVWVSSAYTLAVASLVLSAGTLGDILGRRAVFAAGVIVMAGGSLMAFWSGSSGVLIAAQAVIGAGGALVLPNSLSLVTASFSDPRERTEAVSIWAGCSGLGLAIGPVVAGELLNHFSWHSVYLLNVGAGIIVLALTAVFVRESRHPGRALDIAGLVTGTIAVASLIYAVIEGSSAGYTSGRLIVVYAVFAVALISFAGLELRHHDPMVDLRLFRSASFSGVMVTAIIAMIAFTGIALVSVLYFERVQDQTALNTGWRLMAMFGPYIVVSAVASRIVARLGFKVTLVIGLLIAGGGAFLLLRIQAGLSYGPVWPGLAVFGIGSGFLLAPSTAAAVISVPERQAGMASATVNMFRQLGSVLGSSILGTIATVQFSRKLTGALAQRGVASPVAQAVRDAATSGHSGGTLPPALQVPVTSAIQHAFTDASRIALLVAALALIAAVIPVAITVKQRPHRTGDASPSGTAAAVAAAGGQVQAIPVSADSPLTVGSPLTSGSIVSGRVRGSGGAPLAGATVTLASLTGYQAGLGRTTDDGGYEIPVADPGVYTLIATAAGYQPAAVPVHANGRPEAADVLLAGAARLAGNVLTSRSAEPVSGATLTIADSGGDVVATTASGEKGQYVFANLVPGAYTLAASAVSCQPAAVSVTVVDGGETVQDVRLATNASVIGTARTGSGGIVPDARVTLLDPHGTVAAVATTGADGMYSLRNIPEGEYTVIAAGYPPSASTLRIAEGEGRSHDVTLGHPRE